MNCPKCGLPKELCVCEEITRTGQKIRVRAEKRRYNKYVTVISGLQNVDFDKVAKELKTRLACGGTSKNNIIELQGNHVGKAKSILIDIGFSEDMIDIA